MKHLKIWLALVLLLAAGPGSAQTETKSNATSPEAIEKIMRRVCDWQLAHPRPNLQNNGWERSAFYTGVMATFDATKDPKYLEAARSWAEANNWQPGPARRHADHHCCGQTYLELYFAPEGRPEMYRPIQARFDAMMLEPKRGREDWDWCDALFMAPPAIARLGEATGQRAYYDFLHEMWWDSTEHLFDKDVGLYYRDSRFFDMRTEEGNKIFWSRGNGWVIGGLARVVDYLPADDPQRKRYIDLYRQMAQTLVSIQHPDGLWRSDLLTEDPAAPPESSGSAFFTYGLAWGVNRGYLDPEEYLPKVNKAWSALVGLVDQNGKLGYVQAVGDRPGKVDPNATHEYGAGAFLLAGKEMLLLSAHRYDFGPAAAAPGYKAVTSQIEYSAELGYGWTKAPQHNRDRGGPDPLRRDMVFSRTPATFRVDLEPGIYKLTLVMGDMQYGDHVLHATINGAALKLPELRAGVGEFATLEAAFELTEAPFEMVCDSPVDNWALNAMTLEAAEATQAPTVTSERLRVPTQDTWDEVQSYADPTVALLKQFKEDAKDRQIEATGLSAQDYLSLIEGNVDYFKQHQDARGAIIDPYLEKEWQYATPSFALGAAIVVAELGREDLLEPAANAMDWATLSLGKSEAPQNHEDFFAPILAHAMPYFEGRVEASRIEQWRENLTFDPWEVYTAGPGGGNWNVVALSGEYLFYKQGLRTNTTYTEECLKAQGRIFHSPWGLYCEGPMPYDHFPRLWAADMLAAGYDGLHSEDLAEMLRRASITSLFIQSPTGELPTGHRSAHHQWNEAEQCVTYEIYAAKALANGDEALAAAFKRGAHLALRSMQRWQRPSGELWIVKNFVEPQARHGYMGYSAHSQYNLLGMAMLAIAYEHAQATESVEEAPAPADVGGFIIQLDDFFHKIFANADGHYLEIDWMADLGFNPTGLLRVHKRGMWPQLGPSDGLVSHPHYHVPDGPRTTAAIGPAWMDVNGEWRRLAEYGPDELSPVVRLNGTMSPERVAFDLIYRGYFSGPDLIAEHYELTPQSLRITYEWPRYDGPIRVVWPILADDGKEDAQISVKDQTVEVSLYGDTQQYRVENAEKIWVGEEAYPFPNGWARLGFAESPGGGPITLVIVPQPGED